MFRRRAAETSSGWSVHLKTSNGFDGIGKGNVLIDSAGKVVYEKAHLPKEPARQCKPTLSKEELNELNDAIIQSKPEGWKIPGLDIAAPDAFGYDLELQKASTKESHEAKWYDNTQDKLPEDLKRLAAAVNKIMLEAAKRCGN